MPNPAAVPTPVTMPLKVPSRVVVDPAPGNVPLAVWVIPNPTSIPVVLPIVKT